MVGYDRPGVFYAVEAKLEYSEVIGETAKRSAKCMHSFLSNWYEGKDASSCYNSKELAKRSLEDRIARTE